MTPADAITDPIEIQDAVAGWQRDLLHALAADDDAWPETPDLPYWTDKPDWDGYGGLVLLAAYDEQPESKPGARKRFGFRSTPPDLPRAWEDSAAFQEAAKAPVRYPTLLSGVEWWLPISSGPSVFEAPRLTGQPTRMSQVDLLVGELQMLASRLGVSDETELDRLRQAGPPSNEADAGTAGRFGLAVFMKLALTAQQNRLPLLLDY
ncbi:MAG: hypothetical protein FWD29_01200 [Micrococcales bacterium]|nr:hypothetical protein [Micrococcales bacterium]